MDTTVASENEVSQWADDEFFEYTRTNPLKFLMGSSPNKPVQVKEQLTGLPGANITFSLVGEVDGDGVADDATLEGSEAQLENWGQTVTVHQIRQGVVVAKYESIKTKIDLWKAAKGGLRTWEMRKLRDLVLNRLISPVTDGLTTYAAASEAQKNAWETANNPTDANQRILFGAAKGNSTLVHATGLGTIDGTADDLHPDSVRLIKRMVQSCEPHVRPSSVEGGDDVAGGERWFGLAGSLAFRDLAANMDTIHQNADVRGDGNKIFTGGMIKVGNVLVFEIPEMDRPTSVDGGCLIEDAGDSGIDVSPFLLLGAQAAILAWAQRTEIHMEEFDYKNKRGVAVSEIRGCKKATFNSFQHGMGTAYVSAVGD